MADERELSHVEEVKKTSRNLRGTIAEALADSALDKFTDDDYELLKFHGSYQGYNRDTATERKKQKLDKEWEMMVRCKIPAGRLSAEQYLALDELADTYGNGTLRITSRQGIQYHNVVKGDLHGLIHHINQAMITTLGGCGDVCRNVMADVSPVKTPEHMQIVEDAKAISDVLLPVTPAYHEIWVDGEKVTKAPEPVDPVYGESWMPRKWKFSLTLPEDNTVDVMTNDVGLVAFTNDDGVEGYNVCLGGGFGMKHNNPDTFPRLATPVAFVPRERVVDVCIAATKLQRDHGDRTNRQHARLKYVMAEKGVDWAKETLDHYFGEELEPARPMPKLEIYDHMGWHEQGDGKYYFGIHVTSGRIKDADGVNVRSALREIMKAYQPNIVLMPTEDMLLCDLDMADQEGIEGILAKHGVKQAHDYLPVEHWAMSCVALPTCGKALAEGERARKPIISSVAGVMKKYGLEQELISVRITGCPNGCSRPYTGDVGIVGRAPGMYAVFVGGNFEGTRLSVKVADKVKTENIPAFLELYFAAWAREREEGEMFGDFCHRKGDEWVQAIAQQGIDAKVAA